jgi:uncharacterized lipoprotein YehR (DUF1307 family)
MRFNNKFFIRFSRILILIVLSFSVTACGNSEYTRNQSVGNQNNYTKSENETAQAEKSISPNVQKYESKLNYLKNATVKSEDNKKIYERKEFGTAWKDVDKNGCDTRNDVLKRDMQNYNPDDIKYADNKKCIIESGILYDPYTGSILNFVRGKKTSSQVQIDHIVALKDSWLTGAQNWDKLKREKFANDLQNLLSVNGATNSKKSWGDCRKGCDISYQGSISEGDRLYKMWVPPNVDYRCDYISNYIDIKKKYNLYFLDWQLSTAKAVMQICISGSKF